MNFIIYYFGHQMVADQLSIDVDDVRFYQVKPKVICNLRREQDNNIPFANIISKYTIIRFGTALENLRSLNL